MANTILADAVRKVLLSHSKGVGFCAGCYEKLSLALHEHEATPVGDAVIVTKKEYDQLQEAKRFYIAHLDQNRIVPGVKNSYGFVNGKPPAEKLADEVKRFAGNARRALPFSVADLEAALDDYDATKNGDPSLAAVLGSPPDPVMVARLLLDSLTGGALSSLICAMRDDVISGWLALHGRGVSTAADAALDNLKSNLRALGEKIP